MKTIKQTALWCCRLCSLGRNVFLDPGDDGGRCALCHLHHGRCRAGVDARAPLLGHATQPPRSVDLQQCRVGKRLLIIMVVVACYTTVGPPWSRHTVAPQRSPVWHLPPSPAPRCSPRRPLPHRNMQGCGHTLHPLTACILPHPHGMHYPRAMHPARPLPHRNMQGRGCTCLFLKRQVHHWNAAHL